MARWRIRHLFVDEFQDVNPAQWRLLTAWLGGGRDLFVVGDPRQAIYGWNGADPTVLDRLPDLVPGTAVLRLDDNHRSTPQVVSAARAVLGAEDIGPSRASRPDGPSPVVHAFDDDDAEAAAVARWLRQAHRPGRPWSHLAVLARTNARLDPIARALTRAGIPFRTGGGAKESADARRALAELRRVPKNRHLRSALVDLVMARQGQDADEADHATPGPGESSTPETGLPGALARLADEHALDFPDATVGEFLDWIVAGGEGAMEHDGGDGVELSTFHRAKGLEWPAVAVVGLEDGMVPIVYAVTPDAVAEERRLLYVALTRAEDELWCSWSRIRRVDDRAWACDASPLLGAVESASHDDEWRLDAGQASNRIASLRTMLAAPALAADGTVPGAPTLGAAQLGPGAVRSSRRSCSSTRSCHLPNFGADFGHARHRHEAESFMEPDRRVVGGVDGGDHRVFAGRPGLVDERAHERTPHARAPVVLAHMDRVLDGEAVAGPLHHVAEPPEAGDAHHVALILGHEHSFVLAQPCHHAVGRVRRVGPFDGGGGDQRAEDRCDGGGVGVDRRPDDHVEILPDAPRSAQVRPVPLGRRLSRCRREPGRGPRAAFPCGRCGPPARR